MSVKDLPKYTSERYYLLSEIEDQATLVYLDPATDQVLPRETKYLAIYLLWQTQDGEAALLAQVEAVRTFLERQPTDVRDRAAANFLMAVEVFQPSTASNNGKEVPDLVGLVRQIQSRLPLGNVLLGVSNALAGTCALEAVLDYVKELHLCDRGLHVLGRHAQDFLGHDVSREPDAVDDIHQFLVSSTSMPFFQWLQAIAGTPLPRKQEMASAYGKHELTILALIVLVLVSAASSILFVKRP